MNLHELTTVDWWCFGFAVSGLVTMTVSYFTHSYIERRISDMHRENCIIERRLRLEQLKGRNPK